MWRACVCAITCALIHLLFPTLSPSRGLLTPLPVPFRPFHTSPTHPPTVPTPLTHSAHPLTPSPSHPTHPSPVAPITLATTTHPNQPPNHRSHAPAQFTTPPCPPAHPQPHGSHPPALPHPSPAPYLNRGACCISWRAWRPPAARIVASVAPTCCSSPCAR